MSTASQRASPDSNASFDPEMLKVALNTAGYHARRLARGKGLSAIDRHDVEQEILLVLFERWQYFDRTRGAWSAFANRIARQALPGIAAKLAGSPHSAAAGLHTLDEERMASWDEPNTVVVAYDTERFLSRLPEDLALVARLALDAEGDLGSALRRSGLSSSEFSRRLNEVRMRLISIGIVSRPSVD